MVGSEASIYLSKLLVFVSQQHGGVSGELGSQSAANFDVSLHLGHSEVGLECLVLQTVHVDYVPCNHEVTFFLLLVADDKEEVEAGHDRGTDVNVESERPRPVITTMDWISCRKDRGSSVQGGMNASLGDRDCLLLHGLMDGCLILDIHLIELINAADAVVCKH